MLQKLSDGAKGGFSKFILVGFLFMAVAGLVLTDVGGFFRDGISSTSVADVGSESVPYHEFDRFARNMLSRQGMSVQDAYQVGQLNELLRRYTQDILFVQNAHKFGVRIPESEIATQLHTFVEPYRQSGEQSPQEAFNQFLAQQGLNEADFVSALRRDMTNNIIQTALTSGITATPSALAAELNRYQNETREISYVTLAHKDIAIETEPTEEELQEFYTLSQAEYRIPERREFSIAIFDPKTITEDIQISDEDLKSYYEENKERYKVPAGRKIEQAIFDTEEEAQAIYEAVQNGSSLKDAANDKYRGEQLIDRDNAPPALAEALFNDSEISLRGPAESPLGWHVMNVLGDTETGYKEFSAVKDAIAVILKSQIENERIFETIDVINDEIDDGATLSQLGDTHKMEQLSIDAIDQFGLNEANEDGLVSFEADKTLLIETVFSLFENELSEMIELSDGRFAIMKIDAIAPEDFKPFESVKTPLSERLIQNRRRSANQLEAQSAIEKLNAGEATLADLGEVKTLNTKRNQREFEETTLSADLNIRLFSVAPENYILTQNNEGFIIAKSAAPSLDIQELDAETQQTFEQIEAIGVLSTYFDHLESETPVKINNQLLNQLYGQSGS